jgi:acyl carrier protein
MTIAMQIQEQLTLIFREVFRDPTLEVSPDMTAADVQEWTSLTHVEMLHRVEAAFNIKFRLADIRKMKNVGDLMRTVEFYLS